MTDNPIQQAAEWIRDAVVVAILTGAGVSKESGVPTFRDKVDGLWAQYDPKKLDTADAFQENPKLVWDWYQSRRKQIRQVQPNPGHYALAQLQDYNVHLITQNIDDLHERAGSTDVIHLHGSIMQYKCFNHCQGFPTILDSADVREDTDEVPPRCPHCGSYVRPGVVWFGEMLPEQEIKRASEISRRCDVMLVVGTSGIVNPAAQLPGFAKGAKAKIIEINPDDTPLMPLADLKLRGASGVILPKIVEALHEL
jgi:NAD-dependent deacetylase